MTLTTHAPTQTAPESVPFHRLLHTPGRRRFWRPLGLVALSSVFFLGGIMLLLPLSYLPEPWRIDLEQGRLDQPADLAANLAAIAMMLPAVLLTWRIFGARGLAHSVVGRFRWELIGRLLPVVIPLALVLIVLPNVLAEEVVWPALDGRLLALLIIPILLVPLQAAGEEYFFRVLPQQALGVWFRSPWVGILLPVPLFMIGHDYSAWGLLVIANFAICAGVLTWRTGGIELAVLIHTVNNLTLFLLATIVPSLNSEATIGPGDALLDIMLTVIVTGHLIRWYDRQPKHSAPSYELGQDSAEAS